MQMSAGMQRSALLVVSEDSRPWMVCKQTRGCNGFELRGRIYTHRLSAYLEKRLRWSVSKIFVSVPPCSLRMVTVMAPAIHASEAPPRRETRACSAQPSAHAGGTRRVETRGYLRGEHRRPLADGALNASGAAEFGGFRVKFWLGFSM